MPEIERIEEWVGQEVVDADGEKLGKLGDVFFAKDSDEPVFGSVKHGLLGRKVALVPLSGATLSRDYVRIAYPKADVDTAPAPDGDGTLAAGAASGLGRHYGIDVPPGASFESASARADRLESAAAERARGQELREEEERRRADADAARKQADEAARAAEQADRDAADARTAAERADDAAADAERGPR